MGMKRIIALVSLGFLLLACDPPEVDVPVSSVSLDKTSVELKVGETVRLSATVLPADAKDKTVTWTSSSQSIATVSPSGEVKAVAVGTASITASAGGKSASCSVKVSESTVSVTSVTLDKDRLDLTIGGTAKLTATVMPSDATDKTVTWESSDASVATVDNDGNVKALKGGTSTVTAKAGGKSASALVDVMDVTPTSFDVAAEGGDIKVTVVTTRKYNVESKPDWITEESVSNQVHTFKVAANEEITERSGAIVISDEAGTKFSCEVKQAGAAKVFSVSPEKVDLGSAGGTFEVTVTANYPTHLSSKPDWVTQKSVKDGVYTFEATANVAVTDRSGVIVFCDDEGVCLPCNVNQSGAAKVFSVSPEKVNLAAGGGTFEVTVTANYPTHLSSTPDWVTQKSVKDGVYTFEVSENKEITERSGVIVFCDDEGVCLPCSVKQAGAAKVFSVSPEKVDLGADGGTFEVTVTANYPTHLSSTPDWVTQKSVKDGVYTFEANANAGVDERSGVIVFCDDEGVCLPCSLKQAGAEVYLTVAPESLEFDPKGGNVSITVTTNDGWTASANASWCTVSPASGSGDGTLKVAVGEYGGQGWRNASVTIKTGKGLVKTIAVDQYGIVPFGLDPYTVDIAQEGGTFDVKITSSYGYHISGMSDWISEVSEKNKVHTFQVVANPEFETRKGVVTFCDDEGTCLSVEVRQAKRLAGPDVVDWSKDFYHRSLVMFFSSSWEGRSPTYERKIKDVQARVPGKIEKLCFYDSRNEIFFEDVETLISAYDVNWSPTCVIDGRKKAYEYWGNDDLYLMILESLEEIESAFPTVSAIGWSSSFSGNKLTVDTHIFVKEAGDYKYTVLLLEDGVKCEQYDDGVYEENYVHDGVARIALTGITGESFKTYSSNTVKSKKFTVTIPDSYVKENLRILVYVQRAYGKMQKVSSTDFDGYYVDNCSSGKAGETKLPSIVTVTSGDNEDATEGKPINW